ncbi:hypothetical protein [Simplicispira sp. 125]|uniref:hypothetical protein n=1 Tax=Simplicispira sp. 125 TaxID=2135643 RepID=UPI00325FCB14
MDAAQCMGRGGPQGVDLDNARIGPAVQNLSVLLSGGQRWGMPMRAHPLTPPMRFPASPWGWRRHFLSPGAAACSSAAVRFLS